MVRDKTGQNRRIALMAATALACAVSSGSAWAQAPAADAPSTNAMVNLIRLLVKQGTITQENGDALLAQAGAEADKARANIEQAAANAGVPPPPAGTIRVPYVPESVRKQIAEQVRTEVMEQAKKENWAAPGKGAPDWTRRITISGDIRVRSESALYSKLNDDTLLDYGKINATTGGFDTLDSANLPFLNTRQDRLNRLKVRARIGIDAKLNEWAHVGVRLATGDDSSPISTNQLLAGGLAKRDIWLDRAYLELRPSYLTSLKLGRFENPFWNTQLLFDDDLNFDGIAAKVGTQSLLSSHLQLTATGGAFPLDFGSANYPDDAGNQAGTGLKKRPYHDKWLFSAQLAGEYNTDSGIKFRAGAAYHHFHNVQGRLSDPCTFNGASVTIGQSDPQQCSSDGSRAFFPRKGNTYFFIRQIALPALEQPGNYATYKQYLGLVQRYHVLDFNGSVTVPFSKTIKGEVFGEYIKNLGFDRNRNCRYGSNNPPRSNYIVTALNNDNACTTVDPAKVVGGDTGWMAGFRVGHERPDKWGEWNFAANYRYLQTDATLDSLTDSDFHLGGTNTKGYTIEGTMGLFPGTSLSARWMSANEIVGSPLSIDVFQLDLNASF